MNSLYPYMWPVVILAIVIFIFLFRRARYQDNKMVFNFWGLKEHKWKKLSFYLSVIALSGLLISLLDFRGEGERLKANIAQQKTVIMIDASASMLAEDVRPNRFEKSIFLARHFIRKASGHQVAVILFSDTHRKLVPFTSDLDLLDARLEALAKKSLSRGGTGLSLALQESINYLRDSEGKIHGNVLLYTDGEENQTFQDLKIPEEVNVAVVGVGTAGGGRIPMRSSRGDFQGYMRFGGQEIISKLDENSIRKIGENIRNFKYWLVSSYSLPTENILNYFQSQFTELQKKGEVLIQPVRFHYIVVPALILWIISMLMGWGRQYTAIGVLILFSFQAKPQEDKKKPQPFAPFDVNKINKLLKQVRSGKAQKEQNLVLAEEILKSGRPQEALTLYQETNKPMMELTDENKKVYFNWATSSLFADQKLLGLNKLSKLEDLEKSKDSVNQEMIKKIRINRLLALRRESQKREEQKKKDKQKKSDKKKKGDEGEPQEQDEQGEEKESDQNKDGEKGQEDEKKDKGSGEDEKTADSKPKKPKNSKKDQKIPARLKELLGKDKQLQEQLLNTRTRERMRKDLKNW